MSQLKKKRESLGVKSIDLARRMNITRQCVCIAEKKGIRNVAAAKRYATALNCNWQEIMG